MKPNPKNSDIADIKTPIESISGATWIYIKEKYGLKVYWIFTGLLLIEIFLLHSFLIIFATIVLSLILYSSIYNKVNNRFYQQIAELNGYNYEPKGHLSVAGHIFQIGDSKRFEDIISGEFESHPLKLFVYRFTTGSGKERSEHKLSICELTFPTQMPNIVLNAHNFSNYNLYDFGLKKLNLEGDFYKYFTLYVTPGHEIEALQIFTPDVMQDFIEKSKKFDLEFIDDKIYILSPNSLKTHNEIMSMFNFAHHLISKLKKVLPHIKI